MGYAMLCPYNEWKRCFSTGHTPQYFEDLHKSPQRCNIALGKNLFLVRVEKRIEVKKLAKTFAKKTFTAPTPFYSTRNNKLKDE